MRIISGKFKGRILKNFQADHIRPTTDRVKETLFNILQSYVEDAKVLDLFSGTGNLSFECVSRGAASVESVEKHPKSLKIIQDNMKLLGIGREMRVYNQDVFIFLKRTKSEPFDLIFIDPPFTEAWADRVMTELSQTTLYKPGTIIAIESAKREKIVEKYGSIVTIDTRHFGDKILTLFKAE